MTPWSNRSSKQVSDAAARGYSEVSAVWFCFVLFLVLIGFGAYMHFESRIVELRDKKRVENVQIESRNYVTELRRAQHKPLIELVNRKATVTMANLDMEVVRVSQMKEFGEALTKQVEGMLGSTSNLNQYKGGFPGKRVHDDDEGSSPEINLQGVETSASDSGDVVLSTLRSEGLMHLYGRGSAARGKNDGALALTTDEVKREWEDKFASRAVGADAPEGEIGAVLDNPVSAPTITYGQILGHYLDAYRHLRSSVERLRAVAASQRDTGSGTGWNNPENAARATVTGNAGNWSSELDAARQAATTALAAALGKVYDAAGGPADSAIVNEYVEARQAMLAAESLVKMFQTLDENGEMVDRSAGDAQDALSSAKDELSTLQRDLDAVKARLGHTDDASPEEAIRRQEAWHNVDRQVDVLMAVDSSERILNTFTSKGASHNEYRGNVKTALESVRDNFESALTQARRAATDYDTYSKEYANKKGMDSAKYTDPHGREIHQGAGGARGQDIAETLKLVYGDSDEVASLEDVLKQGIGDLEMVTELITALKDDLEKETNETLQPAIDMSRKAVRRDGQNLSNLLVTNRFFFDIPRGQIVGDPTNPAPSARTRRPIAMAVAYIDLGSDHNLKEGVRFGVYEPLMGGARDYKAVARVVQVDENMSRVTLQYLPGVDPVTKPVVKGDRLSNALFNPSYERNAVVLAPEGQSFLASDIGSELVPHHFKVQTKLDEDTDMIILTGSRSDSLAALSSDEDADDESGPWFKDNEDFQEAKRRGLRVFFFEDQIRPLIPNVRGWKR